VHVSAFRICRCFVETSVFLALERLPGIVGRRVQLIEGTNCKLCYQYRLLVLISYEHYCVFLPQIPYASAIV